MVSGSHRSPIPGTPIYVQAAGLTAADQDDYAVGEACVSFAGAEFVQVSFRGSEVSTAW